MGQTVQRLSELRDLNCDLKNREEREEFMNRQTKIFLLAASIAFTVSGIVRADNDKDKGKGCSNSTLQGL
jgi:hypothetical protein